MGPARSAALVFLVMTAGAARAQEQEQQGQVGGGLAATGHVALSTERMFGYLHTSRKTGSGMANDSSSSDTISLLGMPLSGLVSPYTFPRVAADLFVAPSLSVGASVSYAHVGSSSFGLGSLNGLLAAPRVGISVDVSPKASVWARAGITYARFWGSGESSSDFFALTLEAPIAFAVIPQVWLTVGPTVDVGLSGSAVSALGEGRTSSKSTDIGVQAGLVLVL